MTDITPMIPVTDKTYELEDNGKDFGASGVQTFAMPAADLPNGWQVRIWNVTPGELLVDGRETDHQIPPQGLVIVKKRSDGALVCNGAGGGAGKDTVLDSGTGTGDGGGDEELPEVLPEDQPLPEAARVVNATPENFATVYANAAPGDHVVLADGNYGAVNLNRAFPAANRLVVKAGNLLGANIRVLTIGGGHVVSGVVVDLGSTAAGGSAVNIKGSNVRLTRSEVRNGSTSIMFGAAVTDVLVDHCDVKRCRDRMFYLADPKNQARLTFARCWAHEMVDGGSKTTCHGFAWNDENQYREKANHIVVRLCYVGPGKPKSGNTDWVHHKGSKCIYAFNWFDQPAGNLISHRFGLRARYVGNFDPGARVNMYDDLGWWYGNKFGVMRAWGGKSAYYDEKKNLWQSVGGFHATKRTRMAANEADVVLGFVAENATNWCKAGSHPTHPDPQPAGGSKPARSHGGVAYAGDDPEDPDKGIKIRAHAGKITEQAKSCIEWAANIDNQPGSAAPHGWLQGLLEEYPWIAGLCPDPTSPEGGPDGRAPWTVAQQLTRGDAEEPTTGPRRKSPGGL